MPGGSTAHGFSMKTFLPAATAAETWTGRKQVGVAKRIMSGPDSITFW
jgi:hypothetical protein